MTGELITGKSGSLTTSVGAPGLPSLIVRAGDDAARRYLEFFAAQIRNRNTREAYLRAVRDFLGWVETEAGIEVRIPDETGHRFHVKVDTDSTANWTPVPAQTGH
jgi:hypothetical protein